MGQMLGIAITVVVFAMVILGLAVWWSRLWRFVGTLVAFGALGLAGIWTEVDVHPLLTAALGYGLGAVGELTRPRPRVASPRATLARRGITDYVRPWVLGLLDAVTTAAAIATVAFLVALRGADAVDRRLLDTSGPATTVLGVRAIPRFGRPDRRVAVTA